VRSWLAETLWRYFETFSTNIVITTIRVTYTWRKCAYTGADRLFIIYTSENSHSAVTIIRRYFFLHWHYTHIRGPRLRFSRLRSPNSSLNGWWRNACFSTSLVYALINSSPLPLPVFIFQLFENLKSSSGISARLRQNILTRCGPFLKPQFRLKSSFLVISSEIWSPDA